MIPLASPVEAEPRELKLSLRSTLEEIARAQAAVERFAEAEALSEQTAFALQVTLEEVLANVVHHGYEGGGAHPIEVRVRAAEAEIELEVVDDGKPFDPLSMPPPKLDAPLEERDVGGLGVHMVKQLMDEVRYRRDGGHNVLTMRKRRG